MEGVSPAALIGAEDAQVPEQARHRRLRAHIRSTSLSSRAPWLIALLFACALVVFAAWFKSGKLVLFWDQTLPLDPARQLAGDLSLWHATTGFGSVSPTSVALLPYFALVAILKGALRSLVAAQAALYFLCLASSVAGFFLLLERVAERRRLRVKSQLLLHMASACGAMLYTFNTYALFYEWRIVSTLIFLQAIMPWLCLTASIAIDGRTTVGHRWCALLGVAGLIGLMAPGLSNPAMLPVVVVIMAVALVLLVERVNVCWLALTSVAAVASTAYWLVPVLANTSEIAAQGSYGGVKSALLENSRHLTLYNVIRLLGMAPITETYKGEPDYPWSYIYSGQGWWLIYSLLPVLWLVLGVSMWRARERLGQARLIALTLSVVLFTCAAAGANGLSGRAFLWIFDNVHVFTAYRDPFYEFGFGLVFVVSLAVFIGAISLQSSRIWPWIRPEKMLVLAIIAIIAMAWPLFSGAVFRGPGRIRPGAYVSFPRAFTRVELALTRDDRHGSAVLEFPEETTPLISSRWPNGFVGLDPLPLLTGLPVLDGFSNNGAVASALGTLYGEFASDPTKGAYVATELGVRWALFRFDNNYQFGGVQSTAAMHEIASTLVRDGLAKVYVNGPAEVLLRFVVHPSSAAVPTDALLASAKRRALSAVVSPPVPYLGAASATPWQHSVQAYYQRSSVDVGSRRLKLSVGRDQVDVRLRSPGEGSVRIPLSSVLRTRFLALHVSLSQGSGFELALSRRSHGASDFLQTPLGISSTHYAADRCPSRPKR